MDQTIPGPLRSEGKTDRTFEDRRSRAWFGYLLAAACLIWVFYDVKVGEVWGHIFAMTWWLLLPAILSDVACYVTQGARWSTVLAPIARLGTIRATKAIYSGLFTNEVLPMRMGEFLRIYLVSKWLSLKMSTVFSSLLIERFYDGIWLALAVGIVALTVPLPRYLVDAEEMLALIVFGATLLFVYLVFRRPTETPMRHSRRFGAIQRILDNLASSLGLMGTRDHVLAAFGLSSMLLVLQILSFWLVMLAYHINLSIWQGAAVFLIVHLGTAVPGAPSNLGTYQFFTVLGLRLFGVDKTLASGFSMVVFLVLTVPLWAIGAFAFARSGITLKGIRQEFKKIQKTWTGSQIPEAPAMTTEPRATDNSR